MFYSFAIKVVNVVMKLFLNVSYKGLENIRDEGGYIICSNHRSLWDPIFVGIGAKKHKLNFMAKKELFSFKPFGAIIKALGAFPVNRKTGDIGAVKNAEEVISARKVLLIFPEGTRSKEGTPLRAKNGAVYVASETNCPILPVAICFDGKIRFRKKVTVEFGKMICSENLKINPENKSVDAKKASELVMTEIVKMVNANLNTNYSVK